MIGLDIAKNVFQVHGSGTSMSSTRGSAACSTGLPAETYGNKVTCKIYRWTGLNRL